MERLHAAERIPRGFSERWLPVAGALLLLTGGSLIALGLNHLVPPCLFHALTGLYCPGCGSGRVVAALSRLDLAAAWRANPLVVVALPPTLYGLIREVLSGWGVAELPWPRLHHRWVWVLFVSILTFWAARNVPAWPFELLAPR